MHLAHQIRLPNQSKVKLQRAAKLMELLLERSVKGLSTLVQETKRWLRSAKQHEVDQRPMGRLQNPESQARHASYMVKFVCYTLRFVADTKAKMIALESNKVSNEEDKDNNQPANHQGSNQKEKDLMKEAQELFCWTSRQKEHVVASWCMLDSNADNDRIFIQPIPRYLLSYSFWEAYLDQRPESLIDKQSNLCKAAAGFLRTYRYLVRHESDFHIAQEGSLCLIPKDVDWASFFHFTSDLNNIQDSAVSRRYCFGELRLTRLNFYVPFLLRKFRFEQVHGQYGDFFARLYGPVLFVFAVVSTILNSMQVALAADQLLAVPWIPVWHASCWFSVISIIGTAAIALCFAVLWMWMFLDEWVYTLRQKWKARSALLDVSKC
jgi:hypothetical protein